eukprot:gene42550-51993_t
MSCRAWQTAFGRKTITPSRLYAFISLEGSNSLENQASELPLDFIGAVRLASAATSQAIRSGNSRLRIDFDTTAGDMTYTSLQNSLPFLTNLLRQLAGDLGLLSEPFEVPALQAPDPALDPEERRAQQRQLQYPRSNESFSGTVRVFFPDMGAAAMCRNNWHLGSVVSQVPNCCAASNILTDRPDPADRLAILVCPQPSEAESVRRLSDLCESLGIPVLLLNGLLISMDQGLGVRARNYRKEVLASFASVYTLRTLRGGALVRQPGRQFSVHVEDAS